MTLITIRETGPANVSPNATVSFDRRGQYPITIIEPFSEKEEQQLEWYFERWLRFPFTKQMQAEEVAANIITYGERLFEQVFKQDFNAFGKYSQARQSGLDTLRFEIEGSPEFHRFHWEALKDPDLPRPFALEALLVRNTINPPIIDAQSQPSPTINLLIITARPGGGRDVNYRTISRPLVESLRQAHPPVRIDIVRPGTYRALVEHLETTRDRFGVGYYHIIHFDLHGALMSYDQFAAAQQQFEASQLTFKGRYGRSDLPEYTGQKGFLFFEGEQPGVSDPAEAQEVADLLINHHIPIAILNACQSGKQVGVSETSLGSRLLQAGVQTVLAMSYSVTVSAATLMMTTLYQKLFDRATLATAIRHARIELYNRKERRAYFDQHIELEDWLLPVVYQSGGATAEVTLSLRSFTAEEQAAYFSRQATRFLEPKPTFGFVGRDVDILQIERRVLAESEGQHRNLLLIRGMGGAGKTTLLRHLGWWWQMTHFVGEVFYFGYDEKAWTLTQILDSIARQLMPKSDLDTFLPMPLAAQVKLLGQQLNNERHLLLLDNLESITGTNLAIQNTLPESERATLRGFLTDLLGGRTIVLLGMRGNGNWLLQKDGGPLREADIYDLPGLDPEAASILAERLLERNVPDRAVQEMYRTSEDFRRLLRLLAGYPLALEVVLANLKQQTPTEVLAGLQVGDVDLDTMNAQSKTESILKCIEYSHSNLSPEAQQLLLCLAPFTGVIWANEAALAQYTNHLKEQFTLAHLPFDYWTDVLNEARNWGLLTPHEVGQDFLALQPIFPYFLRTRLDETAPERRNAIYIAFQQYYNNLSMELKDLLRAEVTAKKRMGLIIATLEYENLRTALDVALRAQAPIFFLYHTLALYFDAREEHHRALEFSQTVLTKLETYSTDNLIGQSAIEFAGVIDDVAKRQLFLKQYEAAKLMYQKELNFLLNDNSLNEERKKPLIASVYHQLGNTNEAQRQWGQAEAYYQKALDIWIECNAPQQQAMTYYQLGVMAQQQRQWKQAERHYQKASQLIGQEPNNNLFQQARIYHQLGTLAAQQQQWVRAEEYHRKALEIINEYNEPYVQGGIYHQLGLVTQHQGRWEQAEEYYQKALEVWINYNDRYEQAKTYHQLGTLAQDQQQWTQAEDYYQKALQMWIGYDDLYQQANTSTLLGAVVQKKQQWVQAEKYYKQALQLYSQFKEPHEQAEIYYQLGTLAQDQQQWTQAEDYYQEALQIWIKCDNLSRQAGTYGQLGVMAAIQEKWEQARNYFLQALQIFLRVGDESSITGTLHNLIRLWKLSQDNTIPAAVAAVTGRTQEEVVEAMHKSLAST